MCVTILLIGIDGYTSGRDIKTTDRIINIYKTIICLQFVVELVPFLLLLRNCGHKYISLVLLYRVFTGNCGKVMGNNLAVYQVI